MLPKGWIQFTVAALHETDETFFDFLEKEFNILEVDHSQLDTHGTVSLLLEDPQYRWFVPPIAGEIHTYSLHVQREADGTPIFKVTLD